MLDSKYKNFFKGNEWRFIFKSLPSLNEKSLVKILMGRSMTIPKILFVSWHFYLDHSNGASISTRELLHGFSQYGWDVKTICGPCVDNPNVSSVDSVLQEHKITVNSVIHNDLPKPFEVYWFKDKKIHSSLFRPNNIQPIPSVVAGYLFLQFVEKSIKFIKPDIVITYGGFWLADKLLRIVRDNGIKSVFMLHNFAYSSRVLFDNVDLTIVPSHFAKRWYEKKLDISTVALPPLINSENIVVDDSLAKEDSNKKYVLYVNPSFNKGVCFFTKLARSIADVRPDIPFLVIESCSTTKELLSTGVDLRGIKNLNIMSATTRPKIFYRHTKITIVPSLFEESFARVAAESIINGIPTIGSDRGALPETIGDVGSLFHIDSRLTPESRLIPSQQDVSPWIDEIIRLWDDPLYYMEKRKKSLLWAKRWNYSDVLKSYIDRMSSLLEDKLVCCY